jgi:hypothetical protein
MNLVVVLAMGALGCAPALDIASGSSAMRLPLPAAQFSIRYWHSMYDAPLVEDYTIDRDARIRLVRVRSTNAAVLEYSGFDPSAAEHTVDRPFEALPFRVAMKEPQWLIIGEQRWSFRDFAPSGERLVLRAHAGCTDSVPVIDANP